VANREEVEELVEFGAKNLGGIDTTLLSGEKKIKA